MASALEIYYLNKSKGKETDDKVKEKAVQEFVGLPKQKIGFFHKLLDILDRPGNATRALLVGKLGGLKGLIPFAQTIENLTGIDVALNKDELVRGTEVIEKWFGKQQQKKGKVDPVDVFGFLVEVIADPLWLTGIGGLTKAGKAAKLSISGIKQAKAFGKLDTVRKMIKAAKAGGKLDSTKLAKAFQMWYKSGGKPLAKTWAKQAEQGQRALLKFAGKTVIKGEKVLGKAEKLGTAFKAGKVGKIFYAPTRRVSGKYKELHEIYTHFGRDLPHVKQAAYYEKIKALFDKGAKSGLSAEDMDKTIRAFVQRKYAKEGAERLIARGELTDKAILKVRQKAATRGRQAREILKAKPKQAKAIKEIGGEYHGLGKEFIGKEVSAGVSAKELAMPIGYARRNPTPVFREFLETNKHHPVVSGFGRDLSTKNPSQIMRNKVLGQMTDDEALKYFQKLGFKGENVFEPGMAASTFSRAQMSTKSIGAADTISEALSKFSKPDMPIWRAKNYTASAEQIMLGAGMNPQKAAMFRGRVVPNEVAKALTEMHTLATSEEALSAFWNGWTGFQRYMKGAFTMPWPAYHSRNMFSNFVLNWIEGVKNPQSYIDALMYQMKKGKALTLPSGKVLQPDDVLRLADEWGILGRSIGMMAPEEIGLKSFKGAKGWAQRHVKGQGAIRKGGQKVGMAVEDNARLAHFIEKLKGGYSLNDAAVSAKKVLFDYGDLSKIEKKYLRDRGIFFYTFMRKNLPLQVETLLKQPGKQALWSHVAGGSPEMQSDKRVPKWWREQVVTRPLKMPFISPKEGQETRIAGLGMPIEEAFGSFAGPGDTIWESTRRIAARQFGRLSPPITAATEFVTGKDIFFDKDIDEIGYAPYGAKYAPKFIKKAAGIKPITYKGKVSRYAMNPRLSWAIRKSPAARIWSSAGMLSRRDEGMGAKAYHLTTGFKPRVIDPAYQEEIGRKKAAKKLLEAKFRMGEIKRFQRFYAPKTQSIDKDVRLLLESQ